MVSLGVVYLVAVLLISTIWGAWLGVLTALASALAFNYFHIPPTGHLRIAETENWVALVVFVIVALIGSSVAQVARARATEADQRRREADLAAEMARLLLRGNELSESLPAAAQRLASALGLPSAAIELAPVEGDERQVAFPLREGTTQLGTLLVPAGLPEETLRRLQERVVPSLEALLAVGLDRDRLLGEVVETRALRRADIVKTTLLRAVSHDLRTPLTAIVAAGEAIASPTLTDAERRELGSVITAESTRLSRLIDNLLDLSRLEGGAADPRPAWCSIEEVINAAVDDLRLPPARFSLLVDPDLPLVRADAAQLERAFANLLENGVRYSGGHPVSVRARVTGGRLLVRVVDRGPGIPPAQRDRVFEPFYRAGSKSAVTAARASGWRSCAASSRPTAAGSRSNRCRARARASWSSSRPSSWPPTSRASTRPPRKPVRDPARPRLRRRAADPARAARDPARRRVRRRPRRDRRRGARQGGGAPAARGDHRPRAARRRRHRGLSQLREWTAIPIIVLSAVGEEDQKVRALEAGADDYVTKPFGARELVARLQAALRRAAPAPDEPVLRADGLEIDVAAHRVHRDGDEVHLTPIEFELLSVLARNRGRLMTHRALLTEVWGPAYADDTATLRTHIANLRRKIEPPGGERATSARMPGSATASAL